MPQETDARIIIDRLLREAGWDIENKARVSTEEPSNDGRADYLLKNTQEIIWNRTQDEKRYDNEVLRWLRSCQDRGCGLPTPCQQALEAGRHIYKNRVELTLDCQ